MTLDRLTTILDAYGADPDRWPAAERTEALALLTRSAAARARLADAARLDHVLDTLSPAAEPSDDLRARLARAATGRTSLRRIAPLLVPLAAAAVLTLWLLRTPDSRPSPRIAVPMAGLGVYETPTDSLLTLDDLDWDPTLARTIGRMHT